MRMPIQAKFMAMLRIPAKDRERCAASRMGARASRYRDIASKRLAVAGNRVFFWGE